MKRFLAIVFILFAGFSFADSPLTSTDFFDAYANEKMVIRVGEKGLDKKILKYLASKKGDPVVKIAIINKASWGNLTLVKSFESYLLSKRKGLKAEVFDYLCAFSENQPKENQQTKLLTADDLMCWAYLKALGNYNEAHLAASAAFLGYSRDEKSMAHKAIMALIACQMAFDSDWCAIYEIGQEIFGEASADTAYNSNKLNQDAIDIILGYLNLYKADC